MDAIIHSLRYGDRHIYGAWKKGLRSGASCKRSAGVAKDHD